MNKKAKVWGLFAIITAVAFTAGAAIIYDHFDDGDIGTNINGVGSGWNPVDTGSNLSYDENVPNASQITLSETTDNAKNMGLISKDTFNATAGQTEALFNVTRLGSAAQAQYFSFFMGNDNLTLAGMHNGIMVKVDMNTAKYSVIGKKADSTTYDLSGGEFNFTPVVTSRFFVNLIVNPDGNSGDGNWTVEFLGSDGTTVTQSRTGNFNVGGDGGKIDDYFTQDVSAGFGMRTESPGAPVMRVDAVTVIPEPATLGLFAAAGGGIMFIRRRMLI